MLLPLLAAILNWHTVVSDVIQDPPFHRNPTNLVQSSLAHFLPTIKQVPIVNMSSFIDREENVLRVPNITKHDEKRKLKKTPRRTIQKIIKKNKLKRKNLNNNSQYATQPPRPKEEFDIYAKEELQQKPNVTTTQSNQKKQRRWNKNKLTRYPMPFHKLSSNKDSQKNMNTFRRNKRNENQNDLFIFKDLDEIEVMSKNKDYDVVKAHLQKHW